VQSTRNAWRGVSTILSARRRRDAGRGKVRLSFSVNSEPSVVTELHDTGKGIPPQMLDRLFQAFATYGKANGTGLGCPFARKYQDIKGPSMPETRRKGGAVFGFTLPLTQELKPVEPEGERRLAAALRLR